MTPEAMRAYLKARYENQRTDFLARLGGKCQVCGTTENLEIDHRDWTRKSIDISGLWGQKNLHTAYAELEKCQALCTAHHIQKSKADRLERNALRTFSHGTVYGFMKKKCACELCGVARREWQDARNALRRLESGRGAYASRVAVERGDAPMPDHGSRNRYRTLGCRCAECCSANAAATREVREKSAA